MREFLADRCVFPLASAVHWIAMVGCKSIYLKLIELYDWLMDTHQARLFEEREAGEAKFRAMIRGEFGDQS
jgi:hypothetical protein